jgi:putative OmpL-like beta-barrel porin-2
MRSALCSALLLGVLAGTAAAQEREVTFAEQPPVTVSGFAVALASYDRNLERNTAGATKLALSLFRPWSDNLYLFGQLTTHVAQHDTSPVHTHIEIDNLIVSVTPPGASALNLSFGRFDAPIGFERDDEPLNLVPTSSFTFEFARPKKLTGALARYAISPRATVAVIAANGWDVELDNNTGKTAGARLQLFPARGAAVGLSALYGPEEERTNRNQRTLLTADATLQPVSRLILGIEANRGIQRSGAPGVGLTWTGVAGTAFWRLGPSLGLTVRGDVLDDPDGVATGTSQTLSSLTISPWYFYREAQEGVFTTVENTTFRLPAFALRPAVRFDRSTQPFFDAAGGPRRSNVAAVVELVYVF